MLTGRKPVRLNQLGHSSLIIYFNLKKPLKNQKQSMGCTPPGKRKSRNAYSHRYACKKTRELHKYICIRLSTKSYDTIDTITVLILNTINILHTYLALLEIL